MAQIRINNQLWSRAERLRHHAPSVLDRLFSDCIFVEAIAMTLDEWIEREFTGHGLAMRRKEDTPIEGEPLMSMAIAKDLTRRAVARFGLATVAKCASKVRFCGECDCPRLSVEAILALGSNPDAS